ncbi:DUF1254 domain-containing protein [Nocardia cyriacigeorgica]|uniref:DUF1254 domain-containing protein n=1 Tax=Nocardia cyriacigeorgica TaxID=135487 RepID=A0A5R8P4S0_9NOCA|nr:DUF1254 domain-containing protein [Nocardia cyriacigeorgica]TLF93533.1 DUF1254 domain-containing protein [Nocardia cyriacigeorgica]
MSDNLLERAISRRAVEAALWGVPAVNFEMMLQALQRDMGGAPNQIVYWSRLLDWKNQTLTPNPDAVYLMAFFDTSDGPVVLEIPPAVGGSITGSVDSAWQTAVADVGIAGIDAGKGARYLLLPPGFDERVPDGFEVLRPETFSGFALLRSNLGGSSDSDLTAAVNYGLQVRLYPLSAGPDSETIFLDASDIVFDALLPDGIDFFTALNRRIQAEPWLTRDKAMIDRLATFGMVKGSPFEPDEATAKLLTDAAAEARAWLDQQYTELFTTGFAPGARWVLPAKPALVKAMTAGFTDPDTYPTDARSVTYSFAFFSAKTLGTGQFYLMTIADSDGRDFDGSQHYRLRVPPQVPVTLYWSVTAYDRATHALIRDMPWASRSSNTPDLQVGDDGSVELFFGPTPPAAGESNWIPTPEGRRFEALFRFYGPTPQLYDHTWTLPDIERLT